MIVRLGERRTGGFPMMSPILSLSGQDVLPVDIHAGVDLRWLWEVISSSRNLRNHRRIARPQRRPARCNNQESVVAKALENGISFAPWEVWNDENDPSSPRIGQFSKKRKQKSMTSKPPAPKHVDRETT